MISYRKYDVNIRTSVLTRSLEEIVPSNSVARVINAFVDSLDLATLGFHHTKLQGIGAPGYAPSMLLKIYLYGYMKNICSSRQLESACCINIELMWLSHCQEPSYHTISTFRTLKLCDDEGEILIDHSASLKLVFERFTKFCKEQGLIGAKTVAVDTTNIRAQNARSRNFTAERLDKKLNRAKTDVEKYEAALATSDTVEQADEARQVLADKLESIQNRLDYYSTLSEQFKKEQAQDPNLTQLSLTDPDSRSMSKDGVSSEVCFALLTANDAKNSLIVDFSIENETDRTLLAKAAIGVQNVLDVKEVAFLGDKGFHSGAQLAACEELGVTTYVAPPEPPLTQKPPDFTSDKFIYDKETDTFTCPIGEQLTPSKEECTKNNRKGQPIYKYKNYSCPIEKCAACPFAVDCIGKKGLENRRGRRIIRKEHQEVIDRNDNRVRANKEVYAQRKCIAEHPFGTIKRSRGRTYTLLKGKRKVTGEFALILLGYNITRVMNIMTPEGLIKALNCNILAQFSRLTRHLQAFLEKAYTITHQTRFLVFGQQRPDAGLYSQARNA
jgi:transposase